MGASTPGAYLPSDIGNNHFPSRPGACLPAQATHSLPRMGTPFVVIFLQISHAHSLVMCTLQGQAPESGLLATDQVHATQVNMCLGKVAQWCF